MMPLLGPGVEEEAEYPGGALSGALDDSSSRNCTAVTQLSPPCPLCGCTAERVRSVRNVSPTHVPCTHPHAPPHAPCNPPHAPCTPPHAPHAPPHAPCAPPHLSRTPLSSHHSCSTSPPKHCA